MRKSEHREVERKYDVDAGTVLPDVIGVDGVASMSPQVTHDLEAVYFDTAALDLVHHGVTLRRRTGGDDAGWHLKLPEGDETRLEVRMPLAESEHTPPAQLLEPVRAIVRDRELQPVARVTTHRLEQTLLSDDGTELAQLSDDHVAAERIGAPDPGRTWREVEVELVNGAPDLIDRLDEVLTAAGCTRARVASKLARALGEAAYGTPHQAAYDSTDSPAVTIPSDGHPRDRPTRQAVRQAPVGELVVRHLAEQVDELHEHDRGVRGGEAASVHRMRIAARRIRSALVTYRTLFQPGSVEGVRENLRWLGLSLSGARDAHVLRAHLDEVLAAEPPELVLGPVAARIDATLGAEHQMGVEEGIETLRSERYYRLLDTLDELLASPPWADLAQAKASQVLPKLLRRDAKRVERAVDAVGAVDSTDGRTDHQARDAALHEARKKAKRYRYAAESAVPAYGKPARSLAKKATKVQTALGEHQDAVVARAALREYAVQAHLSGENGFTFGRLHALEQERGQRAEADFERAWARVPRRQLRRLLKG